MKRRLALVATFLGVCAVAAGGVHLWNGMPRHTTDRKDPSSSGTTQANEPPAKDRVILTEAKMQQAAIQVGSAELRLMQPTRTVPGHIDYNGTRHVSVKSPADGLVRKMAVIVGDRVEAGQLLAVINSPELGERRADVLKQQAELELARRERQWWRSIQSNLEDLLAQLKRPQEIEALEKEFHDRILGDYRRDIFSAYSKFRTAEAINTNLKPLTGGVISQRVVLEQASARDSAAATFQAACEQATFDVQQKVGKADSVFDDASRRLAVARQRLAWLIGQNSDPVIERSDDQDLSTWPVVAPFAATVEDVVLAASERVTQGEAILLLADTTRLWVKADIRDKDWSALALAPGQTIQIQSPALPDRTLDATIAFIGRTVSSETRATPLVADIANGDRLLKPGMFVRVQLPDGPPVETLAIPESAIVRHEGRVFVFVATGPREFAPRDVTVGRSVDSWVEIKSGVAAGEPVAVTGAFLLKSELLLEPEE